MLSYRFDELLDVVQRAAERQGYILDRSLLPWGSAPQGAATSAEGTSRFEVDRFGLDVKVETNVRSKPRRGRPGLLVFKGRGAAAPKKSGSVEPPPVLLAFVVPESPISGIEKDTFVRCLDLIDSYFYHRLTREPQPVGSQDVPPVSVLHILAPCFSGSQTSLEWAIRGWGKRQGRPYHFRIVSNSASQIDQKHIEGIFLKTDHHHHLTFHSMVHQSTTVLKEILNYINQHPDYVAILTESNTGLTQIDINDSSGADEFVFPLHISEVRKIYEKEGLLHYTKFDANAAPERLTIPADEAGAPRDLPRSSTPSSSAAIDEMALTRILTTMSHRPYRAIGIVATDSLDIVFLARRVRRFCPNVRLFTIQSDLLFARPRDVDDLRGMLIGSTYPLYPANQWISRPHIGPRVLFSDQFAQGLYNAMVAHLWELGVDDSVDSICVPRLLEYGPPYEATTRTSDRPPVWNSAVGQRGLFPVKFVVPDKTKYPDETKYLYDPMDSPERGRITAVTSIVGHGPPDEKRVQKAMRPNPHPLYLCLFLFLFLACIVVAARTWVYARWAIDEKKKNLNPKIWFLGFSHVLEYLNCAVALKDYQKEEAPPVNAGIHVCLINLLVLGLYYYVLSFWLVAMAPYFCLEPVKTICEFGFALAGAWLVASSSALAVSEFGSQLVLKTPDFLGRLRKVWRRTWLRKALVQIKAWNRSRVQSRMSVRGPKQFRESVLRAKSPWKAVAECLHGVGSSWKKLLKAHPLRFFAISGILIVLAWLLIILFTIIFWPGTESNLRLAFERITNLPSGVSPVFPLMFLAGALAAWIHSQLASRRLYRLSYLSEKPPQTTDSSFERILDAIRRSRRDVDSLIRRPHRAFTRVNPVLSWGLVFLFCVLVARLLRRGWLLSFEGPWFDFPFWVLFFCVVGLIMLHAFQLLVLWGKIRSSLRLAVELPMAEAVGRIPTRIKGWFFGEEDFAIREQLVLQQTAALKNRSTSNLAEIFEKVFNDKDDSKKWRKRSETLQSALKEALETKEGTLESTQSVYSFMTPLWESLPVLNLPQRSRAGADVKEKDADWQASWPFSPTDCSQVPRSAHVTKREHEIVRDWARIAEDLIALQIVRWFAPALSQFLPIMYFVVLGSLSLLMAATSYPFDHQGWLMMVMVILIVFVAGSVGTVLIGVNRDELISRVSDTTPGRLTFDRGFISVRY